MVLGASPNPIMDQDHILDTFMSQQDHEQVTEHLEPLHSHENNGGPYDVDLLKEVEGILASAEDKHPHPHHHHHHNEATSNDANALHKSGGVKSHMMQNHEHHHDAENSWDPMGGMGGMGDHADVESHMPVGELGMDMHSIYGMPSLEPSYPEMVAGMHGMDTQGQLHEDIIHGNGVETSKMQGMLSNAIQNISAGEQQKRKKGRPPKKGGPKDPNADGYLAEAAAADMNTHLLSKLPRTRSRLSMGHLEEADDEEVMPMMPMPDQSSLVDNTVAFSASPDAKPKKAKASKVSEMKPKAASMKALAKAKAKAKAEAAKNKKQKEKTKKGPSQDTISASNSKASAALVRKLTAATQKPGAKISSSMFNDEGVGKFMLPPAEKILIGSDGKTFPHLKFADQLSEDEVAHLESEGLPPIERLTFQSLRSIPAYKYHIYCSVYGIKRGHSAMDTELNIARYLHCFHREKTGYESDSYVPASSLLAVFNVNAGKPGNKANINTKKAPQKVVLGKRAAEIAVISKAAKVEKKVKKTPMPTPVTAPVAVPAPAPAPAAAPPPVALPTPASPLQGKPAEPGFLATGAAPNTSIMSAPYLQAVSKISGADEEPHTVASSKNKDKKKAATTVAGGGNKMPDHSESPSNANLVARTPPSVPPAANPTDAKPSGASTSVAAAQSARTSIAPPLKPVSETLQPSEEPQYGRSFGNVIAGKFKAAMEGMGMPSAEVIENFDMLFEEKRGKQVEEAQEKALSEYLSNVELLKDVFDPGLTDPYQSSLVVPTMEEISAGICDRLSAVTDMCLNPSDDPADLGGFQAGSSDLSYDHFMKSLDRAKTVGEINQVKQDFESQFGVNLVPMEENEMCEFEISDMSEPLEQLAVLGKKSLRLISM